MKELYCVFLSMSLLLISCVEGARENVVMQIELAHQKSEFQKHQAVQFDLNLMFGGSERLDARMTLLTNSSKGLIEAKDGSKIYFDQSSVHHSPEMENPSRVRFDAFTWSYFFLFPYKLSDPGTLWSDFGTEALNGEEYITQKLNFIAGTGDAPDDWYCVYVNPETNLIEVAAYIVTASKSRDEAEQDPHAIQYQDYIDVEGVPLASDWTFWEWRKEGGLTKELGTAKLSNISFVDLAEGFFVAPPNYLAK